MPVHLDDIDVAILKSLMEDGRNVSVYRIQTACVYRIFGFVITMTESTSVVGLLTNSKVIMNASDSH